LAIQGYSVRRPDRQTGQDEGDILGISSEVMRAICRELRVLPGGLGQQTPPLAVVRQDLLDHV
jgi:hypothetical protein